MNYHVWWTETNGKLCLGKQFIDNIRGCIQKFPDWPPGPRTSNGTALCHNVQLYRYFVSQSSEFCCHNPLFCFSTSVYCCCLLLYRLRPETFGYTLVPCSQHANDYSELDWNRFSFSYNAFSFPLCCCLLSLKFLSMFHVFLQRIRCPAQHDLKITNCQT
jgi:hypothetical protein